MIFEKTKIDGVLKIIPEMHEDERGIFRRHFCIEEFRKNKIDHNVMQANVSENNYKHTLRGFHYQTGDHAEGKTLSCLKGKIFDIVVDLRKKSKTFKHWISFELSDANRCSIHIPRGCANAFLTLQDECIIHYYCSNNYNSSSEKGIRYNDPSFNFKWPNEPKIISNKDLNHQDFVS